MKRIYKYPIRVSDEQIVTMPANARPLSTGYDATGGLCIWALVNPEEAAVRRTVIIHGTGHPANDVENDYKFLGTVVDERLQLVWHVFIDDGIRWDNR